MRNSVISDQDLDLNGLFGMHYQGTLPHQLCVLQLKMLSKVPAEVTAEDHYSDMNSTMVHYLKSDMYK